MSKNMEKMNNIPTDFISDETGQVFTACKVCEVDLSSGKVPYAIEKAVRKRHDGTKITLFELAICFTCAEKQTQKMSKESKAFLHKTMLTAAFMENRAKIWKDGWQNNWNKKCVFSSESIGENEEYHIVGHFLGNQLLPGQAPFLIGPEMIAYLQDNLSEETKEEFDQFGKQFLGPNPSIAKLLEEYQFMLI